MASPTVRGERWWRVGDWRMFVPARTEALAQREVERFVGIPGAKVPRVRLANAEELIAHTKAYGAASMRWSR